MPKTINYSLSTIHYNAARLYHSTASVWLSVDPLSDKYPSVSPYVYCAGNPVVMKDEDGRDYEVVVDDEKKTITVQATYYAMNQKDYEKLQKGLAAWNNQSGQYALSVEGKEYTVNFNLIGIVDEEGFKMASRDVNENRGSRYNAFAISDTYEYYNDGDRGLTRNGHVCYVKSDAPDRTTIHEIGHTLGLGDYNGNNVMVQGSNSACITNGNVMQILNSAGIVCLGGTLGGNMTSSSISEATLSQQNVTMKGKFHCIPKR